MGRFFALRADDHEIVVLLAGAFLDFRQGMAAANDDLHLHLLVAQEIRAAAQRLLERAFVGGMLDDSEERDLGGAGARRLGDEADGLVRLGVAIGADEDFHDGMLSKAVIIFRR